jgi:oligopeptide transport system ATP-binding protein
LLASTPRLDEKVHGALKTIAGQPRAAMGDFPGCPFEPRCTLKVERCRAEMPALLREGAKDGVGNDQGRAVACHESGV